MKGKLTDMKLLILLMAIPFLLAGCREEEHLAQDADKPAGRTELSGYVLTPIDGGLKRAEKLDKQGNLLERGYVRDGKKHGQWISYNSAGNVAGITPYLQGRINGSAITFNQRMQIQKVSTMEGNEMDGLYVQYDNGRPIQRLNYQDGKLHGVQHFYFKSGAEKGKLQRAVEYKMGVIDGYMRYYDTEGNVTVEYQYKNGERVGGGMIE